MRNIWALVPSHGSQVHGTHDNSHGGQHLGPAQWPYNDEQYSSWCHGKQQEDGGSDNDKGDHMATTKWMNMGMGQGYEDEDEAQVQMMHIIIWAPGKFISCSFLHSTYVVLLSLSTGFISWWHDNPNQCTCTSTCGWRITKPQWAAYTQNVA